MAWPIDRRKLERFRSMMAEQELDAVVVRSPDNIVYLDSYWCMKGYDVLVFPATGEPVLIVLEPQLEEAARTGWTQDIRAFGGRCDGRFNADCCAYRCQRGAPHHQRY